MPEPRRFTTPNPSLDEGGETRLDATAREFLDAREPRVPSTTAEMRDATKHAFDSVLRTLGNTASLEEWIAATNDLETAFFESNGGALAEQIRLALGKDTLDAVEWAAAEELVRQTAAIASRIYPIVHRLQALGFAATREEVVRKLEVSDLPATTKVHNVSIVPRRRTLVGLLRDLDSKLGANVWSLEFPPEIPAKIVVADPFDEGAEDTARLWRHRIVAKNAVEPGIVHSIYSISGDVSAKVAFELGTVGKRTNDASLKEATSTIVAWLDRKSIYYQDPDKRDFALYHLGMEQPQDLMDIFRSLDRIKHADPELFLELVGINPDGGGKSPYFGSFLHKALYNTQMAVDRADNLGELAIRTMLRQLFTLDAKVSTYSGVVSKEAMDAMGAEIQKNVAAEPTDADKARALVLMAVPFAQVALDAEIRRQLEALREINLEKIKDAFAYRIADVEHPLKLLEYLKWMPRTAFNDETVYQKIRSLFEFAPIFTTTPETLYEWIHDHLDHGNLEIVTGLYQRIPLLDESRADLGFARRIFVALRDIDSQRSIVERNFTIGQKKSLDSAAQALKARAQEELSLLLGSRECQKAIHDALPESQRNILHALTESTRYDLMDSSRDRRDDRLLTEPIYFGKLFYEQITKGRAPIWFRLKSIRNPDLVLLSILANPGGPEIAFQHFDKFCERIPAERLRAILYDKLGDAPKHPALEKFHKLFLDQKPEPHTAAYVAHLRGRVAELYHFSYDVDDENNIANHIKLYHALVEKKTPWSVSAEIELIDNAGTIVAGAKFKKTVWFDLWNTIEHSDAVLSVGFDGKVMPTPSPEKIEWGVREQEFVAQQLREGFVTSLVRTTEEDGPMLIMYKLADANNARHMLVRGAPKNTVSLRDDPRFHVLPLNLKSRPA